MFNKILIANRGEIAVRVNRTAQSLGYRTVRCSVRRDRDAPHVRLADEAVCIGPASASESHLNVDAIVEAARRTGLMRCIHPYMVSVGECEVCVGLWGQRDCLYRAAGSGHGVDGE